MESMINQVDYSRQESLDRTLERNTYSKESTNIIVGCGGIGFWLGIMLAMLGHKSFVLIDGDTLDNSNLNRLPVPQTWTGVNKAVALRKTIRTLRPDTLVMALSTHLNEDTFSVLKDAHIRFRGANVPSYSGTYVTIWDTTDDARVQAKLYAYVSSLGDMHAYRKLGYEGFEVGAYANYNVWTAEDYETGYRTSNANAVTSALSACIGIFARSLTNDDVEIDIRDILTNDTVSRYAMREALADISDELGLNIIDMLHERGVSL